LFWQICIGLKHQITSLILKSLKEWGNIKDEFIFKPITILFIQTLFLTGKSNLH